jgi:glycine/D-amino acid oxidase-like deaminating enzyme
LEESLWISGTKKTNYQTLEKDEKADVCVIGGGIVGAITAYLLTKKGLNVIVLEKDKLCMGVTANSTAKLTSQHGLFYKYLYDEYGADFAKLYLESNENGIKLAEEIIQNENIDCIKSFKISTFFSSPNNFLKTKSFVGFKLLIYRLHFNIFIFSIQLF